MLATENPELRDRSSCNLLIQLEDLEFCYASKHSQATAWCLGLKHLTICSHSLYHLRGNNMAGKTTLLRILSGLEQVPFSARTRVTGPLAEGHNFRIPGRNSLPKASTSLVSIGDRMFPELTIWDNVRLGRARGRGTKDADALERLRALMNGVPGLKNFSPESALGVLSSGGHALIRLARAYAWRPRLVLIDEVTAHLDEGHAKEFFFWLGKLVAENCSAILVSHVERDHELLDQLAHQLSVVSAVLSVEGRDGRSWLSSAP